MNELRGLWRGKRIDDSEWVKGDMSRLRSKNRFYIEDNQEDWVCEVDSSTLGECTGLRDKNGKPIFEGDICAVASTNIADDEYGVVKYDDDEAAFVIEFDGFTINFVVNINSSSVEIIGDIHDNPELLNDRHKESGNDQ